MGGNRKHAYFAQALVYKLFSGVHTCIYRCDQRVENRILNTVKLHFSEIGDSYSSPESKFMNPGFCCHLSIKIVRYILKTGLMVVDLGLVLDYR